MYPNFGTYITKLVQTSYVAIAYAKPTFVSSK